MPIDDPVLSFETAADWADWLARHHAASSGVWLRLAKKSAGVPSPTYAEALQAALCYGWIDGQKRGDGAAFWLQRFTPRARRSLWSKVNRETALRLIAEGRMQPAGLAEIERARADGRWNAAYDPPSAATVPPDLAAALAANPQAGAVFAALDARNRYAVLHRIQTAKRTETRALRIARFVEQLARGETPYPQVVPGRRV